MDLGQFLYTIKKIEIQVFSFFLMLNRTAVTLVINPDGAVNKYTISDGTELNPDEEDITW
jgi:hypothetical protein